MRKLLLFALLFAVIAAKPGANPYAHGAPVNENITVFYEYLTDSDGYNYGVNWFLSSTVTDRTCVSPYISEQANVNGAVASPVLMQPNESRVPIGAFIAADRSKSWSVNVKAKWKSGTC